MKEQKNKANKTKLLFFVIGLILFKSLIWDEFIVHPTASDALKEENGDTALVENINQKESFGVLKLNEGFRVYALAEDFWGWKITDEAFLSSQSTKKQLNIKRKKLQWRDDKIREVILITTTNENIARVLAFDNNNNNEINLSKVPNNNKDIYYAYNEKRFPLNIRVEAYSSGKKLLYKSIIKE